MVILMYKFKIYYTRLPKVWIKKWNFKTYTRICIGIKNFRAIVIDIIYSQ